jgi:hypothetical protein
MPTVLNFIIKAFSRNRFLSSPPGQPLIAHIGLQSQGFIPNRWLGDAPGQSVALSL